MSHKTNSQPRIIVIYVLLTRGGKRINMQITVSNNLIRIFYDDLINLIFTVFFLFCLFFVFCLFVDSFIHSFGRANDRPSGNNSLFAWTLKFTSGYFSFEESYRISFIPKINIASLDLASLT